MMTEWADSRTGGDVHPGAKIGSHFFIERHRPRHRRDLPHRQPREALHGVTPGARNFAKDEDGKIVKVGKRHPDVRDTVTIYPNSAIGANVFLMQSVPANSLVVQQSTQLAILDKAAKAQTPEPPLEWSI